MLKNCLKLFIVLLLSIFYVAYVTHKIMILWVTGKSFKYHLKITKNYLKYLDYFKEKFFEPFSRNYNKLFFHKIWTIFFTVYKEELFETSKL